MPPLSYSGASSTPQTTRVLELDQVVAQIDHMPVAAVEILSDIPAGALPQLLQLLKEENGEFGGFSSVLKEPAPIDLQRALCKDSERPASLQSAAELAKRDELLRETITELEEEGFVNYVISQESAPLRTRYAQVRLLQPDVPPGNPLHGLPDCIHGRHLVAVLQALRFILREVRARKAELDRCTVWNPREGLRPLPGWVMEQAKADMSQHAAQPDEKDAWWEGRPENASSDTVTTPASLTSLDVDMIGFVWWACQASLDVPEHVKRFLADASIRFVLQRCGFSVDSIQEGRSIQGSDAKQEECLNRFLDLLLGCNGSRAISEHALWSTVCEAGG